MISDNEIKSILDSVRTGWRDVSEKDIAFCILLDFFCDKNTVFNIIYGKGEGAEEFCETRKLKRLRNALMPFGVGAVDENSVSREQNKAEVIKMLQKIDTWGMNGEIEPDKYAKLVLDYRARLQDKFDMEDDGKQQRIIIVPQKHDVVCPHTHRECTFMPTKEACMEYYGLTEGKKKRQNYEQSTTHSA